MTKAEAKKDLALYDRVRSIVKKAGGAKVAVELDEMLVDWITAREIKAEEAE